MKVREEDLLYPKETPQPDDPHWSAEWLVTNGLGGYASGTVAGKNTRGFHGYLIAALPSPFGRTMMLNEVYEEVELPDGTLVPLDPAKQVREEPIDTSAMMVDFRLELGVPVWTFRCPAFKIERRLWMIHAQNTVHISYKLIEGNAGARLTLRPAVNIRPHEAPVSTPLTEEYALHVNGDRYEVCTTNGNLPPLRLSLIGENGSFTIARRRVERLMYQAEASRGYAAVGELWMPGCFSAKISVDSDATLIASTESWDAIGSLTPPQAQLAEYDRRRRLLLAADQRVRGNLGQQLVVAADQFITTPAGRIEDTTRARAAGDEIRTIIAGYHWFTDWGRDTMISLEGLTLCTGRKVEASYILRTFAHAIRHGLIPNMFPEGKRDGLYHTADATLWFFHAIERYLNASHDKDILPALFPRLLDIMDHHIRGTGFGIHVDPSDGLLRQGEEGYQLTWMDAKVDDWVVTPRRGKAVEINALWYNALRLMEDWCLQEDEKDKANQFSKYAEEAQSSFNRQFWYGDGGYLYDLIDGEDGKPDPSFRPNQIFAISLKYPILNRDRWEQVLIQVKERLLTPVGLRSLAPGSKDYKSRYDGDLRSRDAAYHQGTVWAWLIGHFIDAWLKVYPDDYEVARGFLSGFEDHMSQACIGSISEIFDAEPPFTPRGCIAQAWSVAEVLRSLATTSREQRDETEHRSPDFMREDWINA
jgi:predicted glycogen debranching enzyme